MPPTVLTTFLQRVDNAVWVQTVFIVALSVCLWTLFRLVRSFGQYTEVFLAAHKSSMLVHQSNERQTTALLKLELMLKADPEIAARYAALMVHDESEERAS